MAEINFNTYGYDYEHGIMILSDSLLVATEALAAKHKATDEERAKYEADVAAGLIEEKAEYDDENGVMIWNQSKIYEHDLELIDEGVQALRKAHVIALYHLWERIICQWTDAPANYKHKDLVELAKAKGIEPNDRFTDVYNLNNVLKHNSNRSGPKLLKEWSEMFCDAENLRARLEAGGKPILWSSSIFITGELMNEVFSAMRRSGPIALKS